MDEYIWASAVGRIRILEKKLLSKAELVQIAESRDLSSAVSMLRDSPYGPYLAALPSPDLFGQALEAALRDEYATICQLSPEPTLIQTYRGRYDFHNVKVYAKAYYIGIPVEEEALSIVGNLEPRLLQRFVEDPGLGATGDGDDKTRSALPVLRAVQDTCARLAQMAASATASDDASRALLLDSAIDREYYRWARSSLVRHGYAGLLESFETEVDILNLKIAQRARRQRIPVSLLSQLLIEGGTVPAGAIVDAYRSGDPAAAFASTPLRQLAASGSSLVDRGLPLTSWEKECDNVQLSVIKRHSRVALGPEPVVGYLLGKESEVRNLRLVLSGKQSMVSPAQIVERLREAYV